MINNVVETADRLVFFWLKKQIAALQAKVRRERQLNKQVQLNTERRRLKKELEEI